MNNYIISKLNPSEIEKLVDLFVLVWNDDKDDVSEKTRWAFENDFSKVLVARTERNQFIGSRGGVIWPLVYKDYKIKCYQFHGTCVHPDFRRQGIFSKLNKDFVYIAKTDGFDLIFNISVKASRSGYEKLGWKYLKGFHRLTKFNLTNYFTKTIPYLVENPSVFSIPDSFLQSREIQFSSLIHTRYDNAFLIWRLSNKTANYKVFQYQNAVVIYKIQIKKGKKEVIIGEVFLLEGFYSEFSVAMHALIKKEKPFMTYTYIYETHPFYNFYLKFFFLPNPFNYHLHFGTRSLKSEDYLKNKKWGISFLDIDTF
jgi:GNAT superfamily N-acetyltransferase